MTWRLSIEYTAPMTFAVSLGDLVGLTRERARLDGSPHVSNERIRRQVRLAITSERLLQSDARDGFIRARTTLTTILDQESIGIPQDVSRLAFVERLEGAEFRRIPRRHDVQDVEDEWISSVILPGYYFERGRNLILRPLGLGTAEIRLTYDTQRPALLQDTDTLELPDGSEDYIAWRAAWQVTADQTLKGQAERHWRVAKAELQHNARLRNADPDLLSDYDPRRRNRRYRRRRA